MGDERPKLCFFCGLNFDERRFEILMISIDDENFSLPSKGFIKQLSGIFFSWLCSFSVLICRVVDENNCNPLFFNTPFPPLLLFPLRLYYIFCVFKRKRLYVREPHL